MNTPSGSGNVSGSVKRQIGSIGMHCDAWKSATDPFPNVTINQNYIATLMLPQTLGARCVYSLKQIQNNISYTLSKKSAIKVRKICPHVCHSHQCYTIINAIFCFCFFFVYIRVYIPNFGHMYQVWSELYRRILYMYQIFICDDVPVLTCIVGVVSITPSVGGKSILKELICSNSHLLNSIITNLYIFP